MAEKKIDRTKAIVFEDLHESEVSRIREVPPAILLSFARFWGSWTAIPPLVRAGHAFGALRNHRLHFNRESEQQAAVAHGLRRRIFVISEFDRAAKEIDSFFAMLVRHADDEAKARGIDGDIVY